jgi:hypothetical protein
MLKAIAFSRRNPMTTFTRGDPVRWNFEAGHVNGYITKVQKKNFDDKGHTHRAIEDEPQYEIKSDKTEHKGSALKQIAHQQARRVLDCQFRARQSALQPRLGTGVCLKEHALHRLEFAHASPARKMHDDQNEKRRRRTHQPDRFQQV